MGTHKPVKIGLFGGPSKYSGDISETQLPRTLDKIEIWWSPHVIDGIRFTNTDTSSTQLTIPSNHGACWGTVTDGNHSVISIDTVGKEYVTKIEGKVGKDPHGKSAITFLTFHTTKHDYEPIGDTNPANGTSFTVPLNNAGVYAFFANYDTYLNALGFYAQQPI